MQIGFPDLKDEEKRTLFIIGNGFDLYHGAKSKYRHFYSWLNLNDHEDFVDEMDWFFPNLNSYPSRDLWSNFEIVLNNYSANNLYQQLREQPNNPWDKEQLHKSLAELKHIVCNMRPLMKEWAQHININNLPKKLQLSKESRYLTFNYTKILEDVYDIPQDKICHIHGSIDSDEVLVGHGLTKAPEYCNNAKTAEEEFVCGKIAEIMQQLYKQINSHIKETPFFNSLQDITNVIIIGHSMSSIDMPYFCGICDKINSDSHWYFSSYGYSDNAEMKIQALLNHTSCRCRRQLHKEHCILFKLPIN